MKILSKIVNGIMGKIKLSPKNEDWARTAGQRILLTLLFLSPFFFLPITADPVNTAKNFILAVFSLTAFLCAIVSFIKQRKVLFPKSFLAIAVGALFVIFLASSAFSKSWILSVYGGMIAPDSLFNIIFYVLLFFSGFYFFEKNDLGKVGFAFFGGVAILDVLMLLRVFDITSLSFWGGSFTPAGSFFNWGAILALSFILLLEVPFKNLSLRAKIFILTFAGLTLFSLYLLNIPALWFATAFVLIISAAIKFAGGKRLAPQMVFATIFLSLFFINGYLPIIKQVPVEISPNITSSLSVSGSTIFGPRILFGSGPATFGLDWAMFRPQNMNNTSFFNFRFSQGFNWYATLLGTLGLFGFLAFLALLYAAFRQVLLAEDEIIKILGVGILFLSVIWIFHPAAIYELILLFVFLGLLAKMRGDVARGEINLTSFSSRKLFATFIMFMVLAVLALSAVFIFGQKYIAAVYNAKALKAASVGNIERAISNWNSAIILDRASDEYLRYGSQALLSEMAGKLRAGASKMSAEEQAQVAQIAKLSVSIAKRATEINPAAPENWSNLGSIYEGLILVAGGTENTAIESYEKASKLDPNNPDMPIAKARVYLAVVQLKGEDDAISYLEQANNALNSAIALKADYALPRFMSGQVLYQMDQFDSARQALEAALNIDPSNLDAHYFLGLVYDKLGLRSQALQQFELLSSVVPNDPNLNRIIKNLKEGRGALEQEITSEKAEK